VANTTLQVFSILFVLITVFLVYTARFLQARRQYTALRPIAGFEKIPMWVGQAIESNRPLHLSLGSAGIGDNTTILSLAGAELFYFIIQEATIGDVSPIITTTSTAAIPLGQDTLRRAYQSKNLSSRYQPSKARWYPQGQRSMAFAAALTGMMKVENPSAHVLVGSFGSELALILDEAHHQKQPTLAVSDQLEGQAIAFALAGDYLIGEEIFAAPGYVSDDPADKAESVVVDIWRGLLILGLFELLMFNITGLLDIGSTAQLVMLAVIAFLFLIGLFVNSRS
jgi:Domain of unknown function (DUF6754)